MVPPFPSNCVSGIAEKLLKFKYCHSISEMNISKELKNECQNLLNLNRRVLILSKYTEFKIFFLIKSIFFL